MSEHTLAFIFPAFANDYTDHTGANLNGFMRHFEARMQIAQTEFDPSLIGFNFNDLNFLDNELLTQYVTYIYGCAAADTLRDAGFHPAFSAGMSMGIYATLYDAGVIEFKNGLLLIKSAYEAITKLTKGLSFSMGTLIGLNRHDLERIMAQSGGQLEITNQNSPYAFVISGDANSIRQALSDAREEGALHTRQLNVNTPYHAGFLREAVLEFEKCLSKIVFKSPRCRILSVISAKELSDIESLKNELSSNLFTHLNWYNTMVVLLEKGVTTLIECGPSKGMVKNSRFVPGNFRFLALDADLH